MDINQLVSFVDYQLGQKQGWDALSEVLHEVKTAKEQVDNAKAEVNQYAQEVDSMKNSLVQMDETVKVKQVELQEKLSALQESHEKALSISNDALKQGVSQLEKQKDDLTLMLAKLEAEYALLQGQKQALDRETAEALDKYSDIQVKLAAIKVSL